MRFVSISRYLARRAVWVTCTLLAAAAMSGPTMASPDPQESAPRDSVAAATDTTKASPPMKPFVALTYPDSLTSVNTHCIVSGSHLNPRVPPVYVNGQPVGFC